MDNVILTMLKVYKILLLITLRFSSVSFAQNDLPFVGFQVSDTTQPKTLIVIAHPNLESFNQAIKDHLTTALEAQNHQVRVRDLYDLGFDPVLSPAELKQYEDEEKAISVDVKAEQEAILWADHIIFVYPTWWWSMPAILKGYFDRVFVPGFAFSVSEKGIEGLLKGKKAWIIQTTGSDRSYIEANGLSQMIKTPMEIGLFNFCGIEVVDHQILAGVPFVSDEERKALLENLKQNVEKHF